MARYKFELTVWAEGPEPEGRRALPTEACNALHEGVDAMQDRIRENGLAVERSTYGAVRVGEIPVT